MGFAIGFLEFRIQDFIDVLLVGIFLYQAYNLMKGSVAIRIFLGLVSVVLLYFTFDALEMKLISTILGVVLAVGPLGAIIIFHPEIRKFLLLVGKTTSFQQVGQWARRKSNTESLSVAPFTEAAKTLSASKTGALIVFSKNSPLKFYAESGDTLDAHVSKRLLLAIFNKQSPLHDGAVIVYDNKLKAARCILPVTEREDVPAQYGLRHRAALGMSENTDTLIFAVSEETGRFSIARNGRLYTELKLAEVRDYILGYFREQEVYSETWLDDNATAETVQEVPKTKEERLKEVVAKEKEKEKQAEKMRENEESIG